MRLLNIQSLQQQVEYESYTSCWNSVPILELIQDNMNPSLEGFRSKITWQTYSDMSRLMLLKLSSCKENACLELSALSSSREFIMVFKIGLQPIDGAGMIFGSQAAREYAQGSQTEWLQMHVGGNFERAT
ncbi:hypothetical protein F3Y22_tig00005929pilonHSYRG00128 [Hibiscus syriacus]|uniref:Uncharacterized protein n=1 Tax=Hibiscus syriacus TaxID=106335 RepID=A0A6A3CCZ0_HIBSY|nr:hypothetical protein F3Y22_tig00005929pilonHSYRG00128 [Hibiscus syriacus]